MIYIVPNYITNSDTYVCPDQATIDQGVTLGFKGTYIIGTEADAQTLLNTSRQEYLTSVLNQFIVNKDINPDPVDTTWVVCDLDTEPSNTDVVYNVFSPKNGTYTTVTGLDNAKNLLAQTKQDFATWVMAVANIITWPDTYKSAGLQTL